MGLYSHSSGTTYVSGDAGSLVVLVRADTAQVAEDDGEYVAGRADAYGDLRVVLPGRTMNSLRVACVHDDENRRLLEEILLELRQLNAARV